MSRFEMYRPLADGRRQLMSTFDSETDEMTMITNATPCVVRTSQAPKPKPQPSPICPRCQSTVCHCPAPEPRPLAARVPRPPITMEETLRKMHRCTGCGETPTRCCCAPPLSTDMLGLVVAEQALLRGR